jgi:hypothetical protein
VRAVKHLITFFAITLTPAPAHANWFKELCEKWLIIAPDPYQYEGASAEWLGKQYAAQAAMTILNKTLTNQHELRVLGDEIRERMAQGLPNELELELAKLLTTYNRYEK